MKSIFRHVQLLPPSSLSHIHILLLFVLLSKIFGLLGFRSTVHTM